MNPLPLQILMPMAGRGQRFQIEGITTIKPLIDVAGVPMFYRALSSFDHLQCDKKNLFVIKQQDDQDFSFTGSIKKLVPEAGVVVLDQITKGPAETCYKANKLLDPDAPLLILDCDLSFESEEYFKKIKDCLNRTSEDDGVLLCFESSNPGYSYVRFGLDGGALETAEKKVISDMALVGTYFFRKTSFFSDAFSDFVARSPENHLGEYYVAPLFNYLIRQGKRISVSAVNAYSSFGTPAELNNSVSDFDDKE